MPEWYTLETDTPARLDQLLARRWELLDHRRIRAMVVQEAVLINGQPAQNLGQWVKPADEVRVCLPDLETVEVPKLRGGLQLSIAYEDDAILMLEKPVGISVRRARGSSRAQKQRPLPQLLAEMRPEIAHVGGVNRAGVVTTLDEDESGLVLAGKTDASYRELRRMVKRQVAVEAYTALVEGNLRAETTIDEPIRNYKHTRRRLAVAHQIRVHLAWFGFPIVGDRVYGSRRQTVLPDRLFLHLSQVQLQHPVSREELKVESLLPPELRSVLQYMRRPKF